MGEIIEGKANEFAAFGMTNVRTPREGQAVIADGELTKPSKEEALLPSVELAYPIAIASYDALIKRIDAIDGRIQTLTTFALALCLAIPTLARAQNQPLDSPLVILAAAGMLIGIVISSYARLTGEVRMLNPAKLWNDSLHLSHFEFKKYAIYYAAESFTHNKKTLDRKWRLSVASMVMFALAVVALVGWGAGIVFQI